MGEWSEVDREYRFINRCIAGAMNLLAWYIIFGHVRVNSARLLRRLALQQGWVSIRQNNSRSSQIRMKSIVDSSRCWMDNSLKWASTERQRLLALHVGNYMGCAATLRHNRAIGRLSRQNLLQQHRYYVQKMSVNAASTTLGLVSLKILVLCGDNRP